MDSSSNWPYLWHKCCFSQTNSEDLYISTYLTSPIALQPHRGEKGKWGWVKNRDEESGGIRREDMMCDSACCPRGGPMATAVMVTSWLSWWKAWRVVHRGAVWGQSVWAWKVSRTHTENDTQTKMNAQNASLPLEIHSLKEISMHTQRTIRTL